MLRRLDFLRSGGCRGHGSTGGRSRPGYFCHQCLTGSDCRSLFVFRRLASWHVRFTVLGSRSLWSEVRTAVSNIVEDITSFCSDTVCALCDQGVSATGAQSMQVMAFFLSDTTKDDLRWDHDHKCHRSCDPTTQPSQRSTCRVLLN